MKTVLKKGDILAGYRGTEVDFYEVVHVTPKTVLLVSIQKKLVDVNKRGAVPKRFFGAA